MCRLNAAGFPRAAILTVGDLRVLVADVHEAMVNDRMLVLGEVFEDGITGSLEVAIRSLSAPCQ